MSLEDHIKNLIAKNGAISIAQFMEEALANPQYGYYQKQDPFGKAGDFVTAPEISQIFGEMIGIWVASVWQSMGSIPIALAELGPGRGTLMQDLLRGTKHIPGFHRNIKVHMVETSPTLQQIQKEKLGFTGVEIKWHKDISSLPDIPTIIIANEFFDALPIHQYIETENGWSEKLVGIQNDKLAFMLSSDNLELGHDAQIGAVLETSPVTINIVEQLSKHIASYGGAMMVVDYGYAHCGYKDTLQSVKNHQYHDILEDVGNADITAHVDFSSIAETAKKSGINASDVITQNALLLALGIEIRKQALLKNASEKQKDDIISATDRLINPDAMGTLFKAITLYNKNLPLPVGF
jgi:NADH dehydrogenase [ubiquinone] 1 alpha subcomplex assembly factor 7